MTVILECIAEQHRRNCKQAERGKAIHKIKLNHPAGSEARSAAPLAGSLERMLSPLQQFPANSTRQQGQLGAVADTNADEFLDWHDSDFTVAELAGTKDRYEHLSNSIRLVVFNDHGNADFTRIFAIRNAAVLFDADLMTAGSFNLELGNALDSFFRQRFFDLVKFERFEDRFYLLHQPLAKRYFS